MDYTLGLDIGITSIGACAIDQENAKLIELSVRKFDQAKEAKEARINRSTRRTLRRKKWRKDQLIAAFNNFGIITKEEIGTGDRKNNYLSFYGKGDGLSVPDVFTVYHLRQKAINEKISQREILLCLYNILQARGHFLFDTIDFTKEGLSFEIFKNKFYEFAEQYVEFVSDRTIFEDNVLKKIYSSDNLKLNDLKQAFKERFTIDEESEDNLKAICNIVAGGKTKIGYMYGVEDEASLNVQELKKKDELNQFQSTIVELYDICRVSKILKDDNQYICDIAVKEIDKYEQTKKSGDLNSEDFKKWKNASKSNNHIRSYKNLNNSYPNGLYIKEVNDILHNQQKYYPEITDEFIEVIKSIISARIPYYIGPLGKNAKNAWAIKEGNIQYSYDYALRQGVINDVESIKKWKENMVSHCTYLPDEIALPKGSLIGETFSILNELNNYNCEDKSGNDYYLTREDKIKILDELFLRKETVTLKDIETLLDLKRFYSQKGKVTKFNNKITIYKQLSHLCESLKIDSIIEILSDKEKINKIESTILDLNLFDEGNLKKKYFEKEFGNEVASKLANIKSNGFFSISRKFIMNTSMNEDGDSMLDILFSDNSETYRNNQQVIISNACDTDGKKIDFLMNKYERIIKENNNDLSIDLILEDGKPLIPISRPVIRALNEAFKVYKGYIDVYGAPSRVVVETAKGKDSIKDFSEQQTFNQSSGSSMKHYDQMPRLVSYLSDQIDEKDKNNAILSGKIEEWNELESYYNQYKDKIELYIRQDGIDLLTGKKIDIYQLENYEIDHILPRGFGDDSQDDKMLTHKLANGKKGDRLPIEFLESSDAKDFTTMTVGRFEDIVNKLDEMKMISSKKKERLLLRNQNEAQGFINQNLVDTRYVISQFISIINTYNRVNNYPTHVVCMNSSFTKLYARILNFRKDRDLGDQHHAYDAACVCIADKCLNEYFPNYDQQKSAFSKKGNYAGFGKYNEFIKELNDTRGNPNDTKEDKIRRFVFFAFKKAYGQDIYKLGKEASLIEEIKSRVPLLSWKVEKNYNGKLFDATLYPPKGNDDKSVLTLLDVNNDKRSFEKVYPIAVDFYKVKHKHYAIHIPLAIVKNNGEIDKEKYIKLIKEHYNAEILLNENGDDINRKLYRFRAFKHDMIYDTESNICHLFNLGSTQIKLLEILPLNVFSYDNIYDFASNIRISLVSRFNIKTKNNTDGVEFKELEKNILIDYMCDKLGLLDNSEKHKKRLCELLINIDELNSFTRFTSYYCQLANDIYALPKFDGQILPSANNNVISKNPDAEYIKIKHHILGVRFNKNDNGKLIIEGPYGYKNGGFKLVKKENFYWTISKDMLK